MLESICTQLHNLCVVCKGADTAKLAVQVRCVSSQSALSFTFSPYTAHFLSCSSAAGSLRVRKIVLVHSWPTLAPWSENKKSSP